VEIALLLLIVVAASAALILREVVRNRRAQRELNAMLVDIDLRPPWSKDSPQAPPDSAETPRTQGVWSAFCRENTITAYVMTHALVHDRQTQRPIGIRAATIELVEDTWWRRAVLASRTVQIDGVELAASPSVTALDIDENFTIDAPNPSVRISLILRLALDRSPRVVERKLCPLEFKFAAAGASITPIPGERPRTS
jgi:hypothetical protein